MSGLLTPDIKEETLGSAEVLEIFKVSSVGKIAGSKVVDGEIFNGSKITMSAKYPFFSTPLFKMPRFSAGKPLNLLTASSKVINPSSRLYLPITRAKLPNALG